MRGSVAIMAGWVLACLLPGVTMGNALAPDNSLRPSLRPTTVAAVQSELPQTLAGSLPALTGEDIGLRPILRPKSEQILAAAALPSGLPDLGPGTSLRPNLRPDSVLEQALFKRRQRRKGAVCGDLEIQGSEVGAVSGKLAGCGAKDAVRVKSIAGVTLSQHSVMTCETAKALKRWIEKDVIKGFGRRNKVVSLRVAAHYSCRTRNNRPGARISEHGRAKAIDISGFRLEDGTLVTVLEGWKDRRTRKRLAKIWKGACGPFGTVLGPEADRYHQDHFHLDVARHRSGAYCR
ncbi:hypothetical protein RSK20926_14169 [Roseobacter sp. SK209-2-6]|uniref:extensin-like domain-containing protein n=1 Tax=Roseobacter sp. SK209-2-6 TaxID=388739 RepID=UPI0000F3D638|nr:extensin family protein [Roseobacter sp. SK209-2-6]EBA15783.1 hypothetical protein RSK20926_14169 [Roseobacter sp. SK209-2-6]